jgi:hypothetical protein
MLDKETPGYVGEGESSSGDRSGGHKLVWVGRMRSSRLRERDLVLRKRDIRGQVNLVRRFVKM